MCTGIFVAKMSSIIIVSFTLDEKWYPDVAKQHVYFSMLFSNYTAGQCECYARVRTRFYLRVHCAWHGGRCAEAAPDGAPN